MAPFFGSNDETAVRWTLGKVYELDLLDEREVLCELEGASHGSGPGLLVVTDLKVLFVRRPMLGRTTSLQLPLDQVTGAEATVGSMFQRAKGRLVISVPGASVPVAGRLNLGRFAELLERGEVPLVRDENVWLGWRAGRLLVTDRRVSFLMGGAVGPRRAVFSVSYPEVSFVACEDDPHGGEGAVLKVATNLPVRGRSVFSLRVLDRARAEDVAHLIGSLKRGDDVDIPYEQIEFDGIEGGQARAHQIARTILRQRDLLDRAPSRVTAESTAEDVDADEPEVPPIAVSLGRGVAKWVNAHGGRLYVWSHAFSEDFVEVKVAIEPPPGVSFVPTDSVSEFDLYVEDSMPFTRPIHIGRRWFGLRQGVSVDTGLGILGGG